MPDDLKNSVTEFEQALKQKPHQKLVLRLYIAGSTSRSLQALTNLRQICDEHLKNGYELEVIDIYQQPEFARQGQIVAAPTLIKELPPPLRKFIGDLSNTEKILVGLEVAVGSKSDKSNDG